MFNERTLNSLLTLETGLTEQLESLRELIKEQRKLQFQQFLDSDANSLILPDSVEIKTNLAAIPLILRIPVAAQSSYEDGPSEDEWYFNNELKPIQIFEIDSNAKQWEDKILEKANEVAENMISSFPRSNLEYEDSYREEGGYMNWGTVDVPVIFYAKDRRARTRRKN